MRTITAVANPVWGDAAHTQIICQVTTKEAGGPHPFNAMASDPEPHGQLLWKDLIAGKYGAIGAYVAPAPQPAPKSQAAQPGPRVVS
ncbi:MAG TPA: hypothetical protein VKV32_15940 [Stellaceae bacterium]|nr:hypothetical protein [Stellaceae bacterium]